jgi:hypothetical protein
MEVVALKNVRVSTSRRRNVCDRLLEQRIDMQILYVISSEMQHGAFIVIPKANDEVCSGSRHPHDPRELTYRYQK